MSITLKSEIPGGGIRSQNAEADFADYIAGRPTQQRVAIVVLQTNSVGMENQQKGRVNKVKYELVHMAEIRDAHEADQLRHRITQLRADAGLEVSQPALFDLSEAEQCEALLDQIKDWASEKELPIATLDDRFYTYFGGDSADGVAKSVQACRSIAQLKEFAYEIGAIPDPKVIDPDEPEVEETSDGEESETEAEQDRTPAGGAVPFTEATEQ